MTLRSASPFRLDNDLAYQAWREKKLANAKTNRDDVSIIHIKKTPPYFWALSKTDEATVAALPISEILQQCNHNSYCFYKLEDHEALDSKTSKQVIHKLAKACGISHIDNNICADEDSLTSIYNKSTHNKREYIPYTNKKLSWHTDGYYNSADKTIYSMLLHCYENADSGGESSFVDHEIIYILLRDENRNWIKALSHPQAMTVPANELNKKIIRKEQTGPVFSTSPQGRLHMRYSARTKNISWHQDSDTQDAIAYLNTLLDVKSTKSSSAYIIKHALRAGEGIITRNILHCREAFKDNHNTNRQRLLFRGRFYDELPNSLKVN